jgi:integrase
MICGCRHGGIPTFTMHDLRHRYVSLLVMAGVPLPLVRSVVGHSRASVTLDVYSHALLDEPAESLAARRAVLERRPGDVS